MSEDSYAGQTSPAQYNWANTEYQLWAEGKHPSEYTAYDGWMSAMQIMWGVPQSVGNLQAKVAELQERLDTFGEARREEVRQLELRGHRQETIIRERDERIRYLLGEVETWKHNLDEFSREWKKTVAEQHQQELDEVAAEAANQERRHFQEVLEKTLADQQTHFDNLKTAVLDAQRQVMLAEFQVQTTRMIERMEAHYAERYRELEASHRKFRVEELDKAFQAHQAELQALREKGLMSMQEYQDGLQGVEERLRIEYLEELEHCEVKIRELSQAVAGAEQKTVQQITDFTDRMLQDRHFRMGSLEDRINLRLDQGVTILKGMVALEVRDRAPHTILDPKLPTDGDFEFWYDQIPENISMSDRDKFRAGWKEALSRLKID